MIIVLEGVDASGKSTLAQLLSVSLHWPIQVSEGPPHYRGEMIQRCMRYQTLRQYYIFDRHPCVSQPIYGTMRAHQDQIPPEIIKTFYDQRPILVYCDPLNRGLSSHQRNAIDTDEHLKQIEASYDKLLSLYRQWALEHAFIWYRIGDDKNQLVRAIKGVIHV